MSQSILEGVTHPFASGVISLLAGLAAPPVVLQTDFPSLIDFGVGERAHEVDLPTQQPRLADSDTRSTSAEDALSAAGDTDADYDKFFDSFPFASMDTGLIGSIDQGIGDGPGFEDRHPGPAEAGSFQEHGDIAVAPLPQAVIGALGMLVTLAGCRHARRRAMESAATGPRRF